MSCQIYNNVSKVISRLSLVPFVCRTDNRYAPPHESFTRELQSSCVCVRVCVRARPNIGGLQQKASCSLCCFLLSFCIQFLQGIADQSEPHNCSWKALPFLLKTNCYYIVPKPLSDIKDSRKRLGGGVHGSCTVHPRQRF